MPAKKYWIIVFFLLLTLASSSLCEAKEYALEYYTEKGAFFPKARIPEESPKPKIGIAFSGGGPVRGMVHLGVIEFFEEKNIKADYVTGTSIGSIIGALYALGYGEQEIEDNLKSVNWIKMFVEGQNREQSVLHDYQQRNKYLFTMDFSKYFELEAPAGIVQGHYIMASMNRIAYKGAVIRDFNDFKRPFRLNMVDLESGSEEVMSQGYVVEGMRASSSMPIVFDPFWIEERLFVDGGLVSNLQCDVVKKMGSNIVIGINIPQQHYDKEELGSLFNVAMQTVAINSTKRVEENKKLADVLIEPDVDGIGFFDFSQIEQAKAEGRRAAEAVFPKLEELLSSFTAEADPVYKKLLELYETGDYSSVKAEVKDGKAEYDLQKNPVLKKIVFKNNTVIGSYRLRALIDQHWGDRINLKKLEQGLNNVLKLYRDKGYILATISDVKIEDGNVTVSMDEGVISKITAEGMETYPDYFITEKFRDLKGKVFDHDHVQGRLDEIYSQGFFRYLYYKIDDTENGKALTIVVSEKGTNSLSAGISVDTDRGLRLLLGMNLVSLGGNKWTVGNQTILASNPSTNFNVEFFPTPLFSYFSFETNFFWSRTSAYINSGTVKTPLDVDNYGANIKGDIHFTPWDDTSLGIMTRYLDTAVYNATGAERTVHNKDGFVLETQIDLDDEDIFPWGSFRMRYRANNMADQNEFRMKYMLSLYLFNMSKVSVGRTTGAVQNYYTFDRDYLLGGMGSLAGWSSESLLAKKFDIFHYKYSLRLYSDKDNILQNAYLNFFADTAILNGAMSIVKENQNIPEDAAVAGWGVGIEGESVLNLKTILNYEYSEENKARVYFKIGNEF